MAKDKDDKQIKNIVQPSNHSSEWDEQARQSSRSKRRKKVLPTSIHKKSLGRRFKLGRSLAKKVELTHKKQVVQHRPEERETPLAVPVGKVKQVPVKKTIGRKRPKNPSAKSPELLAAPLPNPNFLPMTANKPDETKKTGVAVSKKPVQQLNNTIKPMPAVMPAASVEPDKEAPKKASPIKSRLSKKLRPIKGEKLERRTSQKNAPNELERRGGQKLDSAELLKPKSEEMPPVVPLQHEAKPVAKTHEHQTQQDAKSDAKKANSRKTKKTTEKNRLTGVDAVAKGKKTQRKRGKSSTTNKAKVSAWQKFKSMFKRKKPSEEEDVALALASLSVMPRDEETIKEERLHAGGVGTPKKEEKGSAKDKDSSINDTDGGGQGGDGDGEPPKIAWWKKPFKWRPDPSASMIVLVMLILIACCLAFILWASFFQIEIASSAQGTIVPLSKVNRIEHLEGGIIDKILVREGQRVNQGQALVELDSTANLSELNNLKKQVAAIKADIARLTAEAKGQNFVSYPDDIVKNYLDYVTESDKLFNFRMTRFRNEVNTNKAIVDQKQQTVNEVSKRLKHQIEELKLISAQVDISQKLLKEGISNKFTHLTLLREAKALQSKVAQDVEALKRANSELAEAKSTLEGVISLHDEEVSKELQEKSRELVDSENKLAKLSDQFKRTTIRSPIDGVVREIYAHTEGEVVEPGEAIMDVVPANEKLVADAQLAIPDIGYVQLGQTAKIRIASADAMRFDAISGKVFYISPDAIQDKKDKKNAYYLVRINPETQYFTDGNVKYYLYPGMRVSVDIITGHRSVMAYLLDPVFGITQSALKER